MVALDVIDSDGHVVETLTDLAGHGWAGDGCADRPAWVLRQATETAAGRLAGWPGLTTTVGRGPFDPEARLADMDREGIGVAVNYPTALLAVNSFVDAADSLHACRAFNSWFGDTYHLAAPERHFAAALVPAGDPAAAVIEAERAVRRELGAPAVMVPPFHRDRHLCDPEFDPLWAALERLDVPAAVHNTRMDTLPHLDPQNFRDRGRQYAASFPFTTMIAMGDVSLGGVLERFPRLRFAFLESSIAWMPSYLARLDDAYDNHGGAATSVPTSRYEELTRRPSEYLLSGNCYFSCEPDEPMFPAVVDALGEDQVVFASDYPHFDCSFPDSVQKLVDGCGLPRRLLTKVTSSNASRLYGIA